MEDKTKTEVNFIFNAMLYYSSIYLIQVLIKV